MAFGMDFRKLKLGEYMAPSSFCLCQYPLKVSLCSRNIFLGTKYDGNYNW